MAKHNKFKAGAQRSALFPACRITEECEKRISHLRLCYPQLGKTKSDLLESAIKCLYDKHSIMAPAPAEKKKDMLNYPPKQLELIPVSGIKKQTAVTITKNASGISVEPKQVVKLVINANKKGLDVNTVIEYEITEAHYNKKTYLAWEIKLEIGQRYTGMILKPGIKGKFSGQAAIFLKNDKIVIQKKKARV